MPRGTFIVFEGADRSGKTTQTRLVSQALESADLPTATAIPWRFPDRTTAIGETINAYLTRAATVEDRALHLLFCANRWEKAADIERALERGHNVVVDRYAYSGVAYSVAKGLEMEWCQGGDVGLPKPDLVVYLELSVECARERGGWGGERYEEEGMQRRVAEVFGKLRQGKEWRVVDASGAEHEVFQRVMDVVLPAVMAEKGEIERLWD